MNKAHFICVPLDRQQNTHTWKGQIQELLTQQWYRLGFMPIPYRSLLVEMRSQFQQPCRFHSSHISHVILSSLYDFVVDYPGSKGKKKTNPSVCNKAMKKSWLTAHCDSFSAIGSIQWPETLSVLMQPLTSFPSGCSDHPTLRQPLECY